MTHPEWLHKEIAAAQTQARLAWLAKVITYAIEDGDEWADSETVSRLRTAWQRRMVDIGRTAARKQ